MSRIPATTKKETALSASALSDPRPATTRPASIGPAAAPPVKATLRIALPARSSSWGWRIEATTDRVSDRLAMPRAASIEARAITNTSEISLAKRARAPKAIAWPQ